MLLEIKSPAEGSNFEIALTSSSIIVFSSLSKAASFSNSKIFESLALIRSIRVSTSDESWVPFPCMCGGIVRGEGYI